MEIDYGHLFVVWSHFLSHPVEYGKYQAPAVDKAMRTFAAATAAAFYLIDSRDIIGKNAVGSN